MVITNNFVFLHYPKTGGTFCATHIKRLYTQSNRQRLANLLRREPVRWYHYTRQHSGIHAIPRYARHLPKLGSVRNPYDQWVSKYEYQIYRHHPERVLNLEQVKEAYPHFPDVSFTEFIRLAHTYWNKVQNRFDKPDHEKVGIITAQFIGMFCPRPRDILRLPKSEITADLIRSKMPPDISFLTMNNLNHDLHDYLSQFNHDTADLAAILESPKILPVKSGAGSLRHKGAWRGYYGEETVNFINDKEAPLFELFPQFQIETYDDSWQQFKKPMTNDA